MRAPNDATERRPAISRGGHLSASRCYHQGRHQGRTRPGPADTGPLHAASTLAGHSVLTAVDQLPGLGDSPLSPGTWPRGQVCTNPPAGSEEEQAVPETEQDTALRLASCMLRP